eukprot:gene8025-12490_t
MTEDQDLHYKAKTGKLEDLKLLVTSENINTGKTMLMHAAFAGQEEVVYYLLSQGALVTLSDNKGKTAATMALESENDKISMMIMTKFQGQSADDVHSLKKYIGDVEKNFEEMRQDFVKMKDDVNQTNTMVKILQLTSFVSLGFGLSTVAFLGYQYFKK